MDAAAEARVVCTNKLLDLGADLVGRRVDLKHVLGKEKHVAFQVRHVLRGRGDDGRMNDAALIVKLKLVENGAARSLGEARPLACARRERHRLA